MDRIKRTLCQLISACAIILSIEASCLEKNSDTSLNINQMSTEELQELFPIVRSPFSCSRYERVLMSQLRDRQTSSQEFRCATHKLAEVLVNKVIECLPTTLIELETPVSSARGEVLPKNVELVSIMRSGDALLGSFLEHFPEAGVSKILIQRNEETAEPDFKYMKLSPGLGPTSYVIIVEPMIATGGTLEMMIPLLKDRGVAEKNMIIASVCVAPEGLLRLSKNFPELNVVMTVLDGNLNEKKYIVPGLGDFGDRYFGTVKD